MSISVRDELIAYSRKV